MNAPRATTPPPVPPKTIWSADKTLRDEFAMAALTGAMSRGWRNPTDVAKEVYAVVDAMLEARK